MDTNELMRTISRTDVTAAERLEALRGLKAKIDSGEIEAPPRGIYVNNHIHTCYSFSPYTPASAARKKERYEAAYRFLYGTDAPGL